MRYVENGKAKDFGKICFAGMKTPLDEVLLRYDARTGAFSLPEDEEKLEQLKEAKETYFLDFFLEQAVRSHNPWLWQFVQKQADLPAEEQLTEEIVLEALTTLGYYEGGKNKLPKNLKEGWQPPQWMTTAELQIMVQDAKQGKISRTLPGEKVPAWSGITAASSVAELNLPIRALHCLSRAEINTIGELVQKSTTDLKRLRSCGDNTITAIAQALAEYGLSLKPEEEEHA